MSKPRGIRVALVSDETVKRLYERVSKRELKTASVARWLEDQASARNRVTGPYVQIVLPAPVGNREVLKLYLAVFLHLRSPTYKGGWRFTHHGERKDVVRVQEWLRQLLALVEHKPVTGGQDWATYLRSAISAFEPDDPPAWAARQAKANAKRFDRFF
jgi:hypothetical protein